MKALILASCEGRTAVSSIYYIFIFHTVYHKSKFKALIRLPHGLPPAGGWCLVLERSTQQRQVGMAALIYRYRHPAAWELGHCIG